jgi:hypothetical protein
MDVLEMVHKFNLVFLIVGREINLFISVRISPRWEKELSLLSPPLTVPPSQTLICDRKG